MSKDFDDLINEVLELKDLFNVGSKPLDNESMRENDEGMIQPQFFNNLRNDVRRFCQYSNHVGTIATVGYFDAGTHAGGEASQWWSLTVDAGDLLKLIENRTAEKVLTCIGNNDRLSLLLALLKKPNTVAGLVENFGYSSSGQVYHHLRPLLAADLVFEDKKSDVKGTYRVRPHRVQGIIILLEGIYYLTHTEFTKGDWDEALKECN